MEVQLCARSKTEVARMETQTWQRQTVVTQGNFPHTPPPSSVHSRHSVSLVQCFSLSNFFQYLYLPYPPNIQQLNIAWLMMRSTLHVSLYRKTLCITTMGDGRRGREKRGILKCSDVFNFSNKEKNPQNHFVLRNQTLEKEILTKLLGSREINQKNCKNSTKLRKCLSYSK